jgi:hypothetical protein
MKENKAQVWYTDFMVGVMIFFIVIIVYYTYAHGLESDPSKITSDLLIGAKAITGSLVKQGYPLDWNESNVIIIGLTDGKQRIVNEKLEMFADMNYSFIKSKIISSNDFYFFLEDLEGNRILINGKEGVGKEPVDYGNMVSLSRVVIYNSKLTSMVVQVWQ